MSKILIIALLPLFAFDLPYRDGQELEVEQKQADELIEAGYAKLAPTKSDLKAVKAAEKLAKETAVKLAEKVAKEAEETTALAEEEAAKTAGEII